MGKTVYFAFPDSNIVFNRNSRLATFYVDYGYNAPPANATITSVTFSIYFKLLSGYKPNFALYTDTPTFGNSSGITQNGYQLSQHESSIGGFSSNTEQSFTFNGYPNNYWFFAGRQTFTACLSPKAWRSSSASTWANTMDGMWLCTVEWEDTDYVPSKPTNLTLSPSTVIPGSSVTLSWSPSTLPSNATSEILGYSLSIYSDFSAIGGTGGDFLETEVFTESYYTFTAPTTQGTYRCILWVQYMDASGEIGSKDYWDDGYASIDFTIANISRIGSPTNLKVNNVSSLYIATQNIPTLTLTWTAAATGTNNSVAAYEIYKNNNYFDRVAGDVTSYPLVASGASVGSYYVKAIPTISGYGALSTTASVSITQITTAPSVSIVYPANNITTNANVNFQWNSATAITGASIQYLVYQGTEQLGTITTTSYTFSITNIIAGSNTTLAVQPRYITASGSYIDGTKKTSGIITRSSSFTMPEQFWTECYDNDNILDPIVKIQNYAHKSIYLSWNAITPANAAEGTSFTYELQRQLDQGAYERIATYTTGGDSITDGSNIFNLNNITEGTSISYRMKITNNFGSYQYSPVQTVTRVITPLLNNVSITNITATSLQLSFDWQRFLDVSADPLKCDVILSYESEACILGTIDLNQAETISPYRGTFSIDLTTAPVNALTALQATVSNGNVMPTGLITVNLKYQSFQSALNTKSAQFNFNYITTPTSYGAISFKEDKEFYNPKEVAEIVLSNFSWKDALGNATPNNIVITKYLSSSYSSRTFTFEDKNNETIATVNIPDASSDLSIILTLKVRIVYANNIIKEYDSNLTLPLKVARWTEEPVKIESLLMLPENQGLEGYINLPDLLCSSSTYPNFVNLELTAVSPIGSDYNIKLYSPSTQEWNSTGNFDVIDLGAARKIRFTIVDSSKNYSDITAIFSAVFTNNIGQNIIVTTNSYRYFTADIDMAVRKGRVGINVEDSFVSANGDSTLQVNAGTQTGFNPIVEVLTTSTADTDSEINFFKLATNNFTSKIFTDGENLFIEKLKTEVGGLTEDRVLISDSFGKITTSTITSTILGHLADVNDNIQTQLDQKQASITGAATTVTANDLTADRVLISNTSGKIDVSGITTTQLNYLSEVTSSIQTQLNNKVSSSTTRAANTIFAGPASGNAAAPTFRTLVATDIPNLNANKITSGNLTLSNSTITANKFTGNGIRYGTVHPDNANLTGVVAGQIYLMAKG